VSRQPVFAEGIKPLRVEPQRSLHPKPAMRW
jgi:hypothetical protein